MTASAWSSAGVNDEAGLPVPHPDEISRPHWDGCKQGRLLYQHCDACGQNIFPPERSCPACFAEKPAWAQSSGRGEIYSYTTVYRPQRPEFEVPYTVVIVRLEEGWDMLSNLLDCPPDQVRIGQTVEVMFVPRGDIMMPMFRRTESAG